MRRIILSNEKGNYLLVSNSETGIFEIFVLKRFVAGDLRNAIKELQNEER